MAVKILGFDPDFAKTSIIASRSSVSVGGRRSRVPEPEPEGNTAQEQHDAQMALALNRLRGSAAPDSVKPGIEKRFCANMMDLHELKRRGWTDAMVKKLLGESDWIARGWGARSNKAYPAAQVEAAEAGSAFREQFLASARRKKLNEEFVEVVIKRSEGLEQAGALDSWQRRSIATGPAKAKS